MHWGKRLEKSEDFIHEWSGENILHSVRFFLWSKKNFWEEAKYHRRAAFPGGYKELKHVNETVNELTDTSVEERWNSAFSAMLRKPHSIDLSCSVPESKGDKAKTGPMSKTRRGEALHTKIRLVLCLKRLCIHWSSTIAITSHDSRSNKREKILSESEKGGLSITTGPVGKVKSFKSQWNSIQLKKDPRHWHWLCSGS